MDYGVMLKKTHPNPSRKSAHHQKQAAFEGSKRQARGMIIKILSENGQISEPALLKKTGVPCEKIKSCLEQLNKEGLIMRKGGKIAIR
jgi:A/G-specific adenine glycosylase